MTAHLITTAADCFLFRAILLKRIDGCSALQPELLCALKIFHLLMFVSASKQTASTKVNFHIRRFNKFSAFSRYTMGRILFSCVIGLKIYFYSLFILFIDMWDESQMITGLKVLAYIKMFR